MPDRERAAHGAAKPVMVLAIVAAIALGLWVVGSLLDVLLLCFSGLLFGLFLQGAGAWMARRTSLPRPVAVGAFCVVLVVVTGVLGWLAAPSVASQIDELTTTLPRALDKAAKPLERFSWVRAVLERAPHADDVLARRETWSRAGGAVSTALGGFGSLVVILFVGLFTAFDPDLYRRGFLRLLAMKGDEATSVRMDWARELANQLLGRIKNRLLCPRTPSVARSACTWSADDAFKDELTVGDVLAAAESARDGAVGSQPQALPLRNDRCWRASEPADIR